MNQQQLDKKFDEKFEAYRGLLSDEQIEATKDWYRSFIKEHYIPKGEVEHCDEPACPACHKIAYNKGVEDGSVRQGKPRTPSIFLATEQDE